MATIGRHFDVLKHSLLAMWRSCLRISNWHPTDTAEACKEVGANAPQASSNACRVAKQLLVF